MVEGNKQLFLEQKVFPGTSQSYLGTQNELCSFGNGVVAEREGVEKSLGFRLSFLVHSLGLRWSTGCSSFWVYKHYVVSRWRVSAFLFLGFHRKPVTHFGSVCLDFSGRLAPHAFLNRLSFLKTASLKCASWAVPWTCQWIPRAGGI